MIKECNFKDGNQCDLTRSYPRQRIECPGEENCILYQIYKLLQSKSSIPCNAFNVDEYMLRNAMMSEEDKNKAKEQM